MPSFRFQVRITMHQGIFIKQIIGGRGLKYPSPGSIGSGLTGCLIIESDLWWPMGAKHAVVVHTQTRHKAPLIAKLHCILHQHGCCGDIFIHIVLVLVSGGTSMPLGTSHQLVVFIQLPTVLIIYTVHMGIIFPHKISWLVVGKKPQKALHRLILLKAISKWTIIIIMLLAIIIIIYTHIQLSMVEIKPQGAIIG